jgi:hypothetical protein
MLTLTLIYGSAVRPGYRQYRTDTGPKETMMKNDNRLLLPGTGINAPDSRFAVTGIT